MIQEVIDQIKRRFRKSSAVRFSLRFDIWNLKFPADIEDKSWVIGYQILPLMGEPIQKQANKC
jgi:hypothetical protein